MPKPLALRELKAQMELKELSLTEVAKRAKLNRSIASDLLNGRRVDPRRLRLIERVIERAITPVSV